MSDNERFRNVETVIGQTESWPCKLAMLMFAGTFLYTSFDLFVGNFGGAVGAILMVIVSSIMYMLPAVTVIQPLTETEREEYQDYIEETYESTRKMFDD